MSETGDGRQLWADIHPLYEAGGTRRLPNGDSRSRRPTPTLACSSTSCCESLAGRPAEAVEHLRQAIALWEPARGLAKQETDFDLIREDPGFRRWWASKTPFAAEEDPALACARGLVVGTSRRAGANDGRDRGTAELGRSP
jgi:hypothetical protein